MNVRFPLLIAAALFSTPTFADGDALSTSARSGTYYQIERDYRKCVSPLCGGFWVSTLNQEKMKCPDGTEDDMCYVAEIDWSESGLSDDQIEKLEWVIDDGDEVILTGKLDAEIFSETWKLGVLYAAQAWTSVQDHAVPEDTWRLEDLGFVCVREPCFNIGAELVNTSSSTTLSGIDLSGVDASEKELEQAAAALDDGELIAPGEVSSSSISAEEWSRGRVLKATSFYLPVEPE